MASIMRTKKRRLRGSGSLSEEGTRMSDEQRELLQCLARARDLLVAQEEDGGSPQTALALARQHLDVSIAALQPGQLNLSPPPLRQVQCTQETQTMRKALQTASVQATPRGTDAASQVRPASVHTASQAAAMVSVATTQAGGMTALGARSMQENQYL